jgi:hypothetical protein
MAGESHPALEHIELPSTPTLAASSPRSPYTPSESLPDLFTSALNADMRGEHERPKLVELHAPTVTNSANLSPQNPLRNSPPLQPGEQPFPGKLPSFDEVC